MIDYLTNLLKLQAIDFDETNDKDAKTHRDELRKTIPTPILGHYDRLVARGKKGVALVRNQVCTGCHMRLPIGTINTLMQNQDIQLCDTCGRYLYLEETTETTVAKAPPAPKAESKPASRARKRKALAQTSA